jgi:hypothetical protein
MIIFTLKDRDNGGLFRYLQECDGIRDNSGIHFLYLRQRVPDTPQEASMLHADYTVIVFLMKKRAIPRSIYDL